MTKHPIIKTGEHTRMYRDVLMQRDNNLHNTSFYWSTAVRVNGKFLSAPTRAHLVAAIDDALDAPAPPLPPSAAELTAALRELRVAEQACDCSIRCLTIANMKRLAAAREVADQLLARI